MIPGAHPLKGGALQLNTDEAGLPGPRYAAGDHNQSPLGWVLGEPATVEYASPPVPEARTDPLIEWAEQRFSTRRFVAHRGWRLHEAFCPEETVLPLPAPGAKPDLRKHRVSPFLSHSVY